MKSNVVLEKSKNFAVRIVNLYKFLTAEKQEYVLSKQLLRAGTSIGANLHETECAISRKDFAAEAQIAFKECNETLYWLDLLCETEYITNAQFLSIKNDCLELYKLLSSITKTLKERKTDNGK